MAGANDASLFPANQKGARVLPFSAAGGMPSAMLAFPKGKTFWVTSIDNAESYDINISKSLEIIVRMLYNINVIYCKNTPL